MAGTAEPQSDRLATAALNALGVPQISKPGRPLVVTGNDEARRRSCGQPLEHLACDPRGALCRRLASAPSMILAQAPSAPSFWTSSATAGSPPSMAHESLIRALRSDVATVSTHLSARRPRLVTPPHGQRNRDLVKAWLVATRKISYGPGQPLDA